MTSRAMTAEKTKITQMNRASLRIPAFLIITLCCIIISCNKDKYTTKPQLSIVSINTFIPSPDTAGDGSLNVVLQYTSKKGNLGGGTFVAIRTRLNQDFIPVGSGNTDTFTGVIPAYPNQPKAQFLFTVPHQQLYESTATNQDEPDTIIFKFAAIDADKNSSDTITSPKIIAVGP
jgi:hypothetical protein